MASTEDVSAFLATLFNLDDGVPSKAPLGGGALRLHPCVDARLPAGVAAHDAAQLDAALAAYRYGLTGVRLEVLDVLNDGDTALVTGEQVVLSRLASAGEALAAAAPPPVARLAQALLPRFAEGRVPTTVALSLGKSDSGGPVVTRLDVSFHLPSALAPHLSLAPWQRRAVERGGGALLAGLAAAGWAAGVAEDAWTAAAAAWRAGGALGTPAFEAAAGAFWEVVKGAGGVALAAAKERGFDLGFGGGDSAGGSGQGEAVEVVGLVPVGAG